MKSKSRFLFPKSDSKWKFHSISQLISNKNGIEWVGKMIIAMIYGRAENPKSINAINHPKESFGSSYSRKCSSKWELNYALRWMGTFAATENNNTNNYNDNDFTITIITTTTILYFFLADSSFCTIFSVCFLFSSFVVCFSRTRNLFSNKLHIPSAPERHKPEYFALCATARARARSAIEEKYVNMCQRKRVSSFFFVFFFHSFNRRRRCRSFVYFK